LTTSDLLVGVLGDAMRPLQAPAPPSEADRLLTSQRTEQHDAAVAEGLDD
jgi:hypothetical protein